MELEVSALHVSAMGRAARELGFDDVVPALSEPVRRAFASPWSTRWHPGAVLIEFSDTMVAKHGAAALEAHGYEMTRRSFGPVLRSLLRGAIRLAGGTPAALFSRLPEVLSFVFRGVEGSWDPSARELTLRYPVVVPPDIIAPWRGVVRALVEVADHTEGRVDSFRFSDDSRTLRLAVSWA